ncbi:hypothetical protein [Paenibacillus sp. 1011MAR3C5]|uniref:hypothetical protein n=1 Tax=Paenibacillus sp. 1011MAR3C5 TaxID=1675787 RepID=UPI0015FEDB8D|nr:hypothetical protein [Paenibacillus sp. 1011MAR3C5]
MIVGGVVVERCGLQFGMASGAIRMTIAGALASWYGQQQRTLEHSHLPIGG